MSRLFPSLPDATPDDREPRVVGVDDEDADKLIAALGSETAREILTHLHDEPATKSELAAAVDTSLQNVQYHLSKLDGADLVAVVDTTYSEKGREMDVYAAADEPLVLFAGGSEASHGIKSALLRLLGGYGLIGLGALAAQRLLSAGPVTTYQSTADGDDAGVATDDTAEEVEEDAVEEVATDDAAEDVADADGGAGEFDTVIEFVTDPLADHALSLIEPGAVFFLGAALVFTLAWAYWYRTAA